jgi:hypothetical protein
MENDQVMMKKTLPFIVKPAEPAEPFATVGDDRVGTLQIPLYGWLTGDEAAIIGAVDPENRQYTESCSAAVELAKVANLPSADAYRALARIIANLSGMGKPLSREEQELKIQHWRIFAPLIHLSQQLNNEQNIRRVTAMARRLDGCGDWTDADSRRLPPPLQAAMAAVAWREEIAMTPEADPLVQAALLEADLGKLLPEPSPRPSPTGETSTGSSEASTPPTPTAAASASGSSRRPTSSKRSTGATAAAAKRSTPLS